MSQNPFYWLTTATVKVNLPVTSLSYSKDNSEKVTVDNLPEGEEIELFIPNDFSLSEVNTIGVYIFVVLNSQFHNHLELNIIK